MRPDFYYRQHNGECYTVDELIVILQDISKQGRGDYIVLCEGGCVGIGSAEVWDKDKEIIF